MILGLEGQSVKSDVLLLILGLESKMIFHSEEPKNVVRAGTLFSSLYIPLIPLGVKNHSTVDHFLISSYLSLLCSP